MPDPLLKSRNFFWFSACAILMALLINSVLPAFFRPVWFDEAITIMDFTLLPNMSDIYRLYNIPNNHIVFNIMLRIWLDICGIVPVLDRISLRLFTVVTAIASVFLIIHFWGRRLSRETAMMACMCLVMSLPFAIYATAIRGYMLSFLFVVIALETAIRFKETGKRRWLALLFVVSMLATGTTPTNLTAFAAIYIYLIPSFNPKVLLRDKTIFLAIIPCTAFLAFYIPIFGKLMKALSLSEGWGGGINASIHFYSAFCLSFLPLIALAVFSAFKKQNKPSISRMAAISAIFLIPFAVFILKSPAPFPRAFFCLWPIWMFILCAGADTLIKKEYGNLPVGMLAGLMLICIAFSAAVSEYKFQLSDNLSKGGQDDFFRPYFMRQEFRPMETVRKSMELAGSEANSRTFVDFSADYPSIIFYGRLLNADSNFWLCDMPRKKVETLGDVDSAYVIARSAGEMESIAKRFGIVSFELAADCGYQKIFKARTRRQ